MLVSSLHLHKSAQERTAGCRLDWKLDSAAMFSPRNLDLKIQYCESCGVADYLCFPHKTISLTFNLLLVVCCLTCCSESFGWRNTLKFGLQSSHIMIYATQTTQCRLFSLNCAVGNTALFPFSQSVCPFVIISLICCLMQLLFMFLNHITALAGSPTAPLSPKRWSCAPWPSYLHGLCGCMREKIKSITHPIT